MMKDKKPRTNRNQVHTPKSPKGMGDFYGTGIRQPLGKMRDGMGMQEITKAKMKKPPKSLA